MIKFLWMNNEDEVLLKLCLSDEEINREIKSIRACGELYHSLILSTSVDRNALNNLLFDAFNFNKDYTDFQLNIQVVENDTIIEEYMFSSTPQIEYNARFDKNSSRYITKLIIKGESLNAYKN